MFEFEKALRHWPKIFQLREQRHSSHWIQHDTLSLGATLARFLISRIIFFLSRPDNIDRPENFPFRNEKCSRTAFCANGSAGALPDTLDPAFPIFEARSS